MMLRRLIVERMLAASTDIDSGAVFAAFVSESEREITRMNRVMKALRHDGVSDSAAIVVAIRQLERLVR
jgi:NAD-specific glutamate dehydrogenase